MLDSKLNMLRKSKHKDRIYTDRKSVNKIAKKINEKLKDVETKSWFRNRKLIKSKMRRNIDFIIKDEMSELKYIIEHYRTSRSLQKYGMRIKLQLERKIDEMINQGLK